MAMYLRRICRPDGQGFEVNFNPADPMGLIIGAGTYGTTVNITATSISIPVSDVEQNVLITLQDDPTQPIQMIIARNDIDQPPLVATCIILLANFFVPPNCTDLTTLDVYVRGFVSDKLYETAFAGDKPVWEKIA